MVIVSAVIPTRGRPELLVRAVRSALSQTLREIEVVVVVDGEDSATRLALQQMALQLGARDLGIKAKTPADSRPCKRFGLWPILRSSGISQVGSNNLAGAPQKCGELATIATGS